MHGTAFHVLATTAPPAGRHESTPPNLPLLCTADADRELRALLSYPLEETLGSEAAKAVVDDNLQQVRGGGGGGCSSRSCAWDGWVVPDGGVGQMWSRCLSGDTVLTDSPRLPLQLNGFIRTLG